MNKKYYVRFPIPHPNVRNTLKEAKELAEKVSSENPGQAVEILEVVGQTITPHAAPVTTMSTDFDEVPNTIRELVKWAESLPKPAKETVDKLKDCITKEIETDRQKLVKVIEECIDEAKRRNERIARFELNARQFDTLNCQSYPYAVIGTYEGYPVVLASRFQCVTEPKQP